MFSPMPPKTKQVKSNVPSNSRQLVAVGPKHVSVRVKQKGKRDENGEKPTTAHALVLRNGKYGARGTGEVMVVSKLTGREKLDLLAEDLIEMSNKALLNPFRLEQCLKIAQSQCNAFLDDIANLQDPDLFYTIIQAEFRARTPSDSKKSDPSRNPSYMASIIATRCGLVSSVPLAPKLNTDFVVLYHVPSHRIHNAYLLASAWKIVLDTLYELGEDGLSDKTVKMQLKNDESLRSRYLVLYDMVNVLVNTSQAKFSVLATTTPHYSRYFKQAEQTEPGDPEIIFDWNELRDACKSFLDSIVIELCFPRAPYPKPILFQILHDAVEESPREAKRFPQQLWDAVGDLSVSLELQQLLEGPLLSPEGDAWKNLPREMSDEYEHWIDAQIYSEKASELYSNYKDIVYPLEKTKRRAVLENMWKYVNLNYQAVSGENIDTLWQLDDTKNRTPQWHSFYIPDLAEDSENDSDHPPVLTTGKNKKNHRKLLAITNGAAESSDDSMPGLQSVSNSSSEEHSDGESDSDNSGDDNEGYEDDDSGYDTEQEDEMRDMLRAAMDTAIEADFFNSVGAPPAIDPFLEERKSNPFLKVLGSLRGRMFSSNPKLKTANRTDPRNQITPGASNTKPVPPLKHPLATNTAVTKPEQLKSHKPTIEEVEDEDDIPRSVKKKKKYKKKKKNVSEPQQEPSPVAEKLPAPVTPTKTSATTPAKAPIITLPPPLHASPTKKPAPSVPKSPVGHLRSNKINAVPPGMSTTSLSIPLEQTTAQSARSYLQSEKLDSQKTKIKSRPDHASLFSAPEKKGFFSKFIVGNDKKKDEQEKKGSKHSWFSRLGKKTSKYMHQLLNTSEDDTKGIAPMKWENFLKLMREMGFEYDPSTAGSSVRFDPPDPSDPSITFHKPHPDPTLQPVMLKVFGKRLKKQYGWTEADFFKHMP